MFHHERSEHRDDPAHTELVAVATAANEGEASMMLGRLESEGISAMTNPSIGGYTLGGGGARQIFVLVRAEDESAARGSLGR